MNATRATRLLNRRCYIASPDGLVEGTIIDIKVAYGATRFEVLVPARINGVLTSEVRTFDSSRVLVPTFETDTQTDLTPVMEI